MSTYYCNQCGNQSSWGAPFINDKGKEDEKNGICDYCYAKNDGRKRCSFVNKGNRCDVWEVKIGKKFCDDHKGITSEEKIMCPHCETEVMRHHVKGNTHLWICGACPNILFEFSTDENIEDLKAYLNS